MSRPNASQYLKSRPIGQGEEACSLGTPQKCCILGHNASHFGGAVFLSSKLTKEKSESPRESRRVRFLLGSSKAILKRMMPLSSLLLLSSKAGSTAFVAGSFVASFGLIFWLTSTGAMDALGLSSEEEAGFELNV